MLNPYIIVYVVITMLCMAALLFVVINQLKEVRRPKNAFTRLRWQLLLLPLLIVASLLLGLPRLIQNLDFHFTQTSQIVRTVSGMVMLASFTVLILGIYTYREK